MDCEKKAGWVVDAKHVSAPYEGRKKCQESDEDGHVYLCRICEERRRTLAKLDAERRAKRRPYLIL